MLSSRRPARRPLAALSALVAAATLALAGCSADTTPSDAGAEPSAEPGTTASETAAERGVPPAQGDVTGPTDPRRVVVLNHALAGYLYALDVPVLATVPEVTDDPDPKFSTF